jgi:hypothetical protein
VVGSHLLQTWEEAAPGLVASAFILLVAFYARARLPAIVVSQPQQENHLPQAGQSKKQL